MPTLRNWRVPGIVLVVSTTVFGCSTDGTITLRNETASILSGDLDNRGFSLSGYETIEITIKVGTDVLIFGPNEKDVDLNAEGCTKFPLHTTVTVKKGSNVTYTVRPDAVCVVYQNEGSFPVDRVYYREAGSDDWGENRIDEPLNIATTISWRFAPGAYDFKMIDVCGDSTEVLSSGDLDPGRTQYVVHRGGDGGCNP